MSMTPQLLLSTIARERFVTSLKELPSFVINSAKPVKTSAVLIPLCVENNEVKLLYTLRSSKLKRHSGQVSFPGGITEKNEGAIETALRETEEETGINSSDVFIWGKMPTFRGREKSLLITPVVGEVMDFKKEKLKPNEGEVEEIFTVSLKALCDSQNHAHLQYKEYTLPVYLVGKHTIWGITGLITHIFLQCFLPPEAYKVNFLRKQYKEEDLMPSKL